MLYNHSLSLALILLFAISFVGHAVCGAKAHNEEALEHGRNAISVWQYLFTSQFWFESFQNWQSEFLAIFAIVVLSDLAAGKGLPGIKARCGCPFGNRRLARKNQCAVKSRESPVGEIKKAHPGTNAPPGTTWRVDGGNEIDQAHQEKGY